MRGREKILANFLGFFNSVKTSGGSLTISFQILERRVSGNLAYDVGVYTLTQKRADHKHIQNWLHKGKHSHIVYILPTKI